MIDNYLALRGAYGRQYSSADEVRADWNDGKDFKIVGGPYCSIRDIESLKNIGYERIAVPGSNGECYVIDFQEVS